ncbi:MAG: 4Fe-4S binding protein [Candidatus Riflebacteria bacterium]|nr:4Fe-4S binding protein [Candidatus Riflebacteria bacterium]
MKLDVVDSERCVGCQCCMFACSRRQGYAGLSRSCIGVKSVGGISRGFTINVCRACVNPPCERVCPTKALVPQQGGGVKLIETKCIGCGNCKEACVVGAVFMDSKNRPMICIHCGYCTKYCPYGVLALKKETTNAD